MDTSHQATTLTVEIGVDLLLKGGDVHVTSTDSDTESGGFLEGLAGDVLVDGNGGVDTTALTEEGADSASGSLWRDEDDIDVLWNVNLGEALEDW